MKFSNISVRARIFRSGAALLALLTAQMFWTNLRAIERQAHSLGPEIAFAIAARDLPIGRTLTVADIRMVPRHQSQMPADTLRNPTAVVGAVVRVGMVQDAPIQTRNLVPATPGNHSVVPVGYRALRVADNAGLVATAGSVVDIIASYANTDSLNGTASGAGAAGSTSIVIARGAIVLSSQPGTGSRAAKNQRDDSINSSGASGSSDSSIIVRVKEDDVTAITFAQSFGVVSIVLAPLENACCE